MMKFIYYFIEEPNQIIQKIEPRTDKSIHNKGVSKIKTDLLWRYHELQMSQHIYDKNKKYLNQYMIPSCLILLVN